MKDSSRAQRAMEKEEGIATAASGISGNHGLNHAEGRETHIVFLPGDGRAVLYYPSAHDNTNSECTERH